MWLVRAVLGRNVFVFYDEASRTGCGCRVAVLDLAGCGKGAVSPRRREGVGVGRGCSSCNTGVTALRWLEAISLIPASRPADHFLLSGRLYTHP